MWENYKKYRVLFRQNGKPVCGEVVLARDEEHAYELVMFKPYFIGVEYDDYEVYELKDEEPCCI
jgi:hypothetical protein